jgi:IS1 family transposase
MIRRADEAEVDEMWSFVGKKHEPRWLWHAIDHWSGRVLAYSNFRSNVRHNRNDETSRVRPAV